MRGPFRTSPSTSLSFSGGRHRVGPVAAARGNRQCALLEIDPDLDFAADARDLELALATQAGVGRKLDRVPTGRHRLNDGRGTQRGAGPDYIVDLVEDLAVFVEDAVLPVG